MEERPVIIPIASGKGGVGKTFFTANLGVALAEMGYPTIVADMDLGGSNLHSFLGLPNQNPGIGDFLKARNAELAELLVQTSRPDLRFLPGDGRTPFMANIPYAQKMRLIKGVVKLPARYILMDLGAGTSFNAIDFFRVAPYGFVITTPEYPSIMNMMAFLKNVLLRAISRSFVKNSDVNDMLCELYKHPMTNGQMAIREIQQRITDVDPVAGSRVEALCKKYRPRIVFNMGDHPDEIKVADRISGILKSILSMEADYFGFLFHDPNVRLSIKKRANFLGNYGLSVAARGVRQVAERVVKFLDQRVNDSSRLLLNATWRFYEEFVCEN